MAYTLISSTKIEGNVTGGTSPPFSSIGADLITITMGWSDNAGGPAIIDSEGNIYIPRTASVGFAGITSQIFDCEDPITNATHTIEILSTNGTNPVAQISCWSGKLTGAFDQENGNNATLSDELTTGSVTPTENEELIIAGFGFAGGGGATIATIDNGFTVIEGSIEDPGNHQGGAQAYLIQAIAAPINPKFTVPVSYFNATSVIATYKTSSIPPPPPTPSGYMQSISIGPAIELTEDVEYALPARACIIMSTEELEISINRTDWVVLTGSNTVGAKTSGGWVRSPNGDATIVAKGIRRF